MKIELTKRENLIINRYRYHLWKITKTSLSARETITRLLEELNEELDVIESELAYERR